MERLSAFDVYKRVNDFLETTPGGLMSSDPQVSELFHKTLFSFDSLDMVFRFGSMVDNLGIYFSELVDFIEENCISEDRVFTEDELNDLSFFDEVLFYLRKICVAIYGCSFFDSEESV